MESLAFIILAPLAAVLMLAVAFVAWCRRDQAGGWALVAFSIAELGWLTLEVLAMIAPSPEASIWFAKGTLVFAPQLGHAWVAFVLSYTERFTRAARVSVWALVAWGVVYGGMSLTNGAHGLIWSDVTVVSDGAFSHVTYTLGPLAWAQTAFAWALTAGSIGALLWAYVGADARSRDLSQWIVAGAFVPLVVSIAFLVGFGPLAKDFTPIAMAVSSGAFALGLARYRLLDLQPMARAALVNSLTEGMLALDDKGRVIDVNPAMRELLGRPEGLIGAPLSAVAPDLAEAVAEDADGPLRLGVHGQAKYFDLRVSPLVNRAGQPTGYLVLMHDVTRRRRERAELHRANAALHEANTKLKAQNDELDAFGHTVAHDLKNSIQGVLGYAEILRDDGPELDPETHRVLSEDLVHSAFKMNSIVHELLLLSGVRKAAVEPIPFDMEEVIGEAIRRVRDARGASGADVSRPASWPEAVGYAPWVEEVWVNYLTNASKYGGPTITLGAETTDAGVARFWVHDDGPGLSPEAQARLFVPFSRVGTQSVEGHGLGLSIVRRIVERLGGTCGVESAPGLGTRFWFALPLAQDAAIEALAA